MLILDLTPCRDRHVAWAEEPFDKKAFVANEYLKALTAADVMGLIGHLMKWFCGLLYTED